jgi:AraC-like DNA-binding protein
LNQGSPIYLAQKLLHEYRHRDSFSELVIEALLTELLAVSSRRTPKQVEVVVPNWLSKACDFIHDGFRENLTLNQIAESANVHPCHLARGFRRYLSQTPGDFARGPRVEDAERLLIGTDKALGDIALEVGFSHQSHFCRVFKSHTG